MLVIGTRSVASVVGKLRIEPVMDGHEQRRVFRCVTDLGSIGQRRIDDLNLSRHRILAQPILAYPGRES